MGGGMGAAGLDGDVRVAVVGLILIHVMSNFVPAERSADFRFCDATVIFIGTVTHLTSLS
jgi:hypothetical protein